MAQRSITGFTLVEVMVAVVLLSVVALGLTATLISTQRALAVSEKWMRATQFAAEGIEQSRAGQSLSVVPDGFARSVRIAPWNGHVGVLRLEVTVAWNDGGARSLQLTTLVRR